MTGAPAIDPVGCALRRHGGAAGDRTALVGDRIALTYGALLEEVERLAATLAAAGPAAIGLLADNGPAWAVVDLAASAAGVPLVPIPPFFAPGQIAHVIADAGLPLVISARDFPGQSSPAITVAGEALFLVATGAAPRSLPEGTAKVTYTSGTTGTPKGVCLSRAHLGEVATAIVEAVGADLAERHLAVLPLAVLLENVAGLHPTLIAGGTYVAPGLRTLGFHPGRAPDWPSFVDALSMHQATTCILVPELLEGLTATLEATQHRLPHLRHLAVGGARVSTALLRRARALGLPVHEGYGLSECGSVVALNTARADREGTVGRILPHHAVTIAADGEIVVKRPGFLGYLGAQADSPTNFHTGDLGRFDTEGYLTVTGRKKNVIITSLGRNIAPEWVEGELAEHPAIAQCVVFGDDAAELTALIAPDDDDAPDSLLAQAVAHANRRLPDYARIGAWRRIPRLTAADGMLTGNGRLRRDRIRAVHLDAAAGPSFFDRLDAAVAAERDALFAVPQIVDGLAGRITRATYIAYLGEAYHHVRHTVPLLHEALERLDVAQVWLRPVLQTYIDEEAGHERWILNDIARSGGNADAVEHGRPRPETAAMVDHAYRFVREVNPVGLLGMIFVLEGTSIELAARGAQALMASLELPIDCFSYLSSHGALDVEHMRFFRDVVNRIETAQDQEAVVAMAQRIFVLFADMFRAIPHAGGLSDAA